MNPIEKLVKRRKPKFSKKGANIAAVATGTYDGPKPESTKFSKPKFNPRKQSLVSRVTGINFDSDPLSSEQKKEVLKAKYEYKATKQREKTKRAKWASASTATVSTGGSVAGSVTGANQGNAKKYEYNYFIDPESGTINNMEKSKDSGTGTTTDGAPVIIVYKSGGEK